MAGDYWRIPRLWPNATVVILGGGPSLTRDHVDACRDRAKVIAINAAYLWAPWADLLYFCDGDRKFFGWHKDRPEFQSFEGLKVTLDEIVGKREPEIQWIRNMGKEGLYPEPDGVMAGGNSGYQAIGLAVHLGAARIVLLGYDMRVVDGRTHWHKEHKYVPPEDCYEKSMLPAFQTIAGPLEELGIEVLNATPGSALEVFPKCSLNAALASSFVKPRRSVAMPSSKA